MIDALRAHLGPGTQSFQLAGEDLLALPAEALAQAVRRHEEALAAIPESLRPELLAAQKAAMVDAHRFVRRYNVSLFTRIAGYVALGRRTAFEYPWPVVAVLGIAQVIEGLSQSRLHGLVGRLVRRAGSDLLDRFADATDDVLRRTNRGIFADSVPTVLYALAAHAARTRGQAALAEALVEGPLPILFDETSRTLVRGLVQGLAVPRGARRFHALADLTLEHFAREQAIFTHHLGPARAPRSALERALARVAQPRAIPAPTIDRGRLVVRSFPLPRGFSMHDHAARVRCFGQAFVVAVTGSLEDYRAAARAVTRRFDPRGSPADPRFCDGPAPA